MEYYTAETPPYGFSMWQKFADYCTRNNVTLFQPEIQYVEPVHDKNPELKTWRIETSHVFKCMENELKNKLNQQPKNESTN